MGLTKVVYSSLIRNFAIEKQRVDFFHHAAIHSI